jgi:hypothetical protein
MTGHFNLFGSLTAAAVSVFFLAVSSYPSEAVAQQCGETFTADVVALDQPFFYNRLGAFNPNGMMYALRRDVVDKVSGAPESAGGTLSPGLVTLRPDKRPRPLVLRMNAGSCLEISFTNLLGPPPAIPGQGGDIPLTREASIHVNGMQLVGDIGSDGSHVGRNASSLVPVGQTRRYKFYAQYENTYLLASMGATAGAEGGGGTITHGLFGAVNVEPAGSEWYRSQLTREEIDLATVGQTPGQGHPILNYDAVYPDREPYVSEGKAGLPIVRMTQGNRIVHSDINAIITGPGRGSFVPGTHYATTPINPDQHKPFREFTVIFHDEVFAIQSFAGFFNDAVLGHTLHGVRDTFAINYATGGIGAEIIANRLGVGPMWDCNDCKYEEFFLTSWVVGDPGMIVDRPANQGLELLPPGSLPPPRDPTQVATRALYPDDPAGVHHSYLNDHVKIRNLHAGPKEQHMFHLHAHQWAFSPQNDSSSYLDGQTIGAGSGYTYDVAHGGSGNRNKTPGDAIFHCHFYPHFAQGMWALWRIHDVFERGTVLALKQSPFEMNAPVSGARALPDGEIVAGTPIPGVVPVPGAPMAPMPGPATVRAGAELGLPGSQVDLRGNALSGAGSNPGYPFYIAGVAGHRPPTPPLDLLSDGGLPRHMITGPLGANADGDLTAHVESRWDFSKALARATAVQLPELGTDAEAVAMSFHSLRSHDTFLPDGTEARGEGGFLTNGRPPVRGAPYADPCMDDNGQPTSAASNPFFRGETSLTPQNVEFGADSPRVYKAANIQLDMIFNKIGYHHPQQRIITLWEDVAPTLSGARPPEPFVMRLNTLDCAEFHHTNLVPSLYELDDYQVRTPTDVIGQHIHMVKFDVTSADGAANGFNYEDGTLSPDEVRERINAINAEGGIVSLAGGRSRLTAAEHEFFGPGPNDRWLGARTTVQRWFADPILNARGEDRTLGVVFTHDHFGPSTHQQVGLYATLLVEPAGSIWKHNEREETFGTRSDGGPTSWQARIIGGNNPLEPSFREFYLEWSDFQHAYKKDFNGVTGPDNPQSFRKAINPVVRVEAPNALADNPGDVLAFPSECPGLQPRPCPEAINAEGHTMYVVNYRNEPVGFRIFDPDKVVPGTSIPGGQADGPAGDLAFAFSSSIERKIPELNQLMPAAVRGTTYNDPLPPASLGGDLGGTINIGTPLGTPAETQLTADVGPTDPATPILRVYQGDRVRIKVQTGATEEAHNITVHGLKWLQEFANISSGWRNTHQMGINEQFQLRTPIIADKDQNGRVADYLYTMNAGSPGYWNGIWGYLRSYADARPDLAPLPGEGGGAPFIENLEDFDNDRQFVGVCPRSARRNRVDITAVRAADVLIDANGLPSTTLILNSRPTAIPDVAGEPEPGGGGSVVEGGVGPLHNPTALLYVRTGDLDRRTGRLRRGAPVEPLILRARAGECIEVTLRNRLPAEMPPDLPGWHLMPPIIDKSEDPKVTFNLNDIKPSSHVGLHPQLLEYDVTRSDGANVGRNPIQTAPPGGVVQYRWYAGDIRLQRTVGNRFRLIATPVEFGGLNLMPADRIEQGGKGLVGGMVVYPRNAIIREDRDSRASASVRGSGLPRRGVRDFVAILQNQTQIYYSLTNHPVPMIGGEGRFSADVSEDSGQKTINYRTEPAWYRLGFPPHLPFGQMSRDFPQADLFANGRVGGDPQTPVFRAAAGAATRFHFMVPDGTSRFGTLAIHGHLWQREPYNGNVAIGGPTGIASNPTSQRVGSQEGLGPSSHYDIVLEHGAGGAFRIRGDYLIRMQDAFKNLEGQWAIFRVE